ncbi:MAG TPA: sulfite exporter TauE/SafE family protein [Xanthobacteraceae bacterium]|nr:sulfite exporter TauE/SafE family protein [Xanthobacteraceae bacterium]
MNAIHAFQPIYAIAGFAIGMLVGMTGIGGGSLMTPGLILLFGMHPAVAVGTDLLHAAVTKTAGSLVHGFNRTIDWRVVRRLATGSIPMTLVTMSVLSALDINSAVARELINAVLTLALIVTAVTLLFRDKIAGRYAGRLGVLMPKQVAVLTVIVGGILGTIVSISSVGAGAIGVTCLVLLYPKLPTARIVGSDIAHAVPLTLTAGIGHWFLGSVDLQVFMFLILGSVPGILVGSYAAPRIPEFALRIVLAAALLVVATKLSIGLFASSTNVVAQTIAPH